MVMTELYGVHLSGRSERTRRELDEVYSAR